MTKEGLRKKQLRLLRATTGEKLHHSQTGRDENLQGLESEGKKRKSGTWVLWEASKERLDRSPKGRRAFGLYRGGGAGMLCRRGGGKILYGAENFSILLHARGASSSRFSKKKRGFPSPNWEGSREGGRRKFQGFWSVPGCPLKQRCGEWGRIEKATDSSIEKRS